MRLVSSPLFLASSHFSVCPSARLYSYGSPHLPAPACHCWGSAFPFLLTQAQGRTPPAQLPGQASPAAPGAASISPRHHPPLLVPRACLPGEHSFYLSTVDLGFSGGSGSKESGHNVGGLGLILGLGRSPGEGHGNPLQYVCLENPMDREAWWASGP